MRFNFTCRTLQVVFTVCSFFVGTAVHSIRKCGQDLCRDDSVCCRRGIDNSNSTEVTCCRQFVDNTYYNIAMVTRKLSGVLLLLLLFALGYLVQRMVCPRSGGLDQQQTTPDSGHPTTAAATTTISREPLMIGSFTSYSLTTAGPAAHLPSYDECKHLPTYEETVRDACSSRGRLEATVATQGGGQSGGITIRE